MQLLKAAVLIGLIGIIGCSAGEAGEPEPAAEGMQTTETPSVMTQADMPTDIQTDSWARLPTVRREELDEHDQHAFDVIVNPDSRYADGLRGPIGMWMYSPKMAEHIFPASSYLRFGTHKDQRLTELAIISTAREINSQYEYSAHEAAARRAGLEEEIIDIVKHRKSLDEAGQVPGLGDVELTIVQFTRELISEPKVSAGTFVRARELFGEQGVMELTGLIGYYNFVDFTIKTFDVQRPPDTELLLPDLR